ncbi:hypothetical protein [Desulfosporosinus shakirovi]|uniref:hypothetical protein n=1 Tax=Desulfosporosinus shakirovi TaxID=2885154 RepID=UPI001E307CE4|nr:hypothetical protein [Desulfosporosinus sp. SRJS8]MCB8818800.1 hypothetical protein [Desulfosporosinus sp. SRJS8]
MVKFKSGHYQYFAIIMIAALLFSTFGTVQGVFADKKQPIVKTKDQLSAQDKQIINDISNMTGIKAEEIMKLKTSSNTWNDVMDKLKNRTETDNQDVLQERINLLAESGLDAEFIKKLREAGFDNSKIIEAKSLVDRVTSQLKKILDANQSVPTKPSNGLSQEDADMQEIDAYKELARKIDPKTAVELLLKLEKDFGSMEKVFDEYLLSLQLEVDLKIYLTDKEAYEKEKSEQSAKFDLSKKITLATIEAKVLELIQNMNPSNTMAPQDVPNKQADLNSVVKDDKDEMQMPAGPLPDVQNPKPPNPQEELMKEVNDLVNKSLNN